MVSGSFNLQASTSEKFSFFIADFAKSIPFGNTLFKMQNIVYFQKFFCSTNNVYGMIPPTIGTGYFYFGFILSPIYSLVFSYISFIHGEKAINTEDSYKKILYLIISLFFSMSFNMYSVQNTFTLIFWTVMPLAIISRICTKKPKQNVML